jgi:hypothetical protein
VNFDLKGWYNRTDKVAFWLSWVPFLSAFLVYFKTMAPTLSFWDCGEFVAVAKILGIPHPPGNPLFVLIGRIVAATPLFADVGAGLSFFSVVCGAFTVWLAYWLIIKLISRWNWETTVISRWIKYLSGITGALFLGYSYTFWDSQVEAEVYAPAILLIFLLLNLAVLWMEHKDDKKGNRLLLLIVFLGFLSLGIHPTVFLVMPAIFLLILLADKSFLKDWRFWVTGIVFALVMHSITPFFVALGCWLFITLLGSLSTGFKERWALYFASVLMVMLAYSVQAYIPIRASLKPAINENNPNTWQTFKDFLERKQYGQINMFERAVDYRRGSWSSQLGTNPRMGFWGFFREQYMSPWLNLSKNFRLPLWIVPLIFGGWGIYELLKKRKAEGTALLFLLLVGTVGLVFYMNFADGTVADPITKQVIPIEVRDRDYFWMPGFVIFAFFMGLGIGAILKKINELFNKAKVSFKGTYVLNGVLTLFCLTLLFVPLNLSWSKIDRSGNYLPWDYAWNLLQSCDQDGIIFTNGDNDTFPLWALQEAYGIRKDVRVVNLSLINTPWYIKQRKNIWGVPISLTDNQIDNMGYVRLPNGKILRQQDQIIDNILETNNWKYPVYFAITVSPENRIYRGESVDRHLRMEGMAYRVVADSGVNMIEPNIMREKMFEVFRFRGISDPKVKKDENEERLLSNYISCYMALADTLRRAKQYNEAVSIADSVIKIFPEDWRAYAFLVQLYGEQDKLTEVDRVVREAKGVEPERLYFNLAFIYQERGETEKSDEVMKKILRINPKFRAAFQVLGNRYWTLKKRQELMDLLSTWIRNNPEDKDASSFLSALQSPDFRFPEAAETAKSIGK